MRTAARINYPTATDQVLVKAAQRGNMAAFEELVARHRDKIYARAFSMLRNEGEAVDLSQEAWIKGWQRLKQFQGEASFVTWMTRIIINLCLDQLRRQKRVRAESIEQLEEELGGVERQMPIITPNPTERLNVRNCARELIEPWLNCRMSTGRCWCSMNLKNWNTKRLPRKWGAPSAPSCPGFYARRKLAALLAGLKREEFR